jgi:hypothetical protein
MGRTTKLFTAGLGCFALGLIICVILKPVGLSINSGISYYGNYRLTIIPYALAVAGYGLFALLLAGHINSRDLIPLRYSFYVFALLCLIITITPYSVSSFLNIAHTTAGSILFIGQLILSGWLIVKMKYRIWPIIFSGLMIASGIATAHYLPGPHGFLIQTQIIFQLLFAALIYYSLNKLAFKS